MGDARFNRVVTFEGRALEELQAAGFKVIGQEGRETILGRGVRRVGRSRSSSRTSVSSRERPCVASLRVTVSRILVLVAGVLWFTGCRREPLQTPTCRDAEKGACSTEDLPLTGADLLRPGEEPSWMVEEDIYASCVLQETGRLEKCRIERGTEALQARIAEVLARRRYVPVLYRGDPISVSYDFRVRLLPIGTRTTEARTAAFSWAADQFARWPDGGLGTVCLASGPGADASATELAGMAEHGFRTVPASACEGRLDVQYVHLRAFQLWGDRGDGQVWVTIPGGGGDDVLFTVQRADGGWSFEATRRDAIIE
jgi:hypothetical protein